MKGLCSNFDMKSSRITPISKIYTIPTTNFMCFSKLSFLNQQKIRKCKALVRQELSKSKEGNEQIKNDEFRGELKPSRI
ncbi:hypothetical protein Leryth_001263 [Lithospermum erythrorhizon]|nr:hypothetical protein Leryth_001263 [Lithospermum erythrorhizon]